MSLVLLAGAGITSASRPVTLPTTDSGIPRLAERYLDALEKETWREIDWAKDLDGARVRAVAEDKPIFVLIVVQHMGDLGIPDI